MLSAAQYRAVVHGWLTAADPSLSDTYGGGALRLVTLGCAAPPMAVATCRDTFTAVFSALQRAPAPLGLLRQAYLFTVQRAPQSGELQITNTAHGAVPMLVPAETVRGGTADALLLAPASGSTVSFFPCPRGRVSRHLDRI